MEVIIGINRIAPNKRKRGMTINAPDNICSAPIIVVNPDLHKPVTTS
jgi:hypothetical protein